jgi:hypothetical protein
MGAMSRPRHVALTVEQIGPNSFQWLLTEGLDGRVVPLRTSSQPFTTYMDALDAGHVQLARLRASDLHGARSGHEPHFADPAELHDAI